MGFIWPAASRRAAPPASSPDRKGGRNRRKARHYSAWPAHIERIDTYDDGVEEDGADVVGEGAVVQRVGRLEDDPAPPRGPVRLGSVRLG